MIGKAVGRRLRELRRERWLSQEELALISGQARTYIAEIESGRRNPTIETLVPIIKALNITFSEFFSSPLFDDENLEDI
ncbi:MAG: helix-turn-helix transcriptional regulator [Eggerthellaceae bacterium]|nr:helix-turn-helix transcriptional regulator [Eggerthellaceae bacterium]